MNRFLFFLLLLLWAGAAVAQEYDTPKPGEGISTFLIRNKRPGRAYYKEFLQLNKQRLRGKEELRLGVKYRLPDLRDAGDRSSSSSGASASEASGTASAGKGTRREPLFGKALAEVKVTGNRLKGACFYVVSGHGGPDPGAIGRVDGHELHEDEYAYDVALRLARNLMQEGAEVHIIIQDAKDGIRDDRFLSNSKRETCMGDPIPLNQVARLEQRCSKINTLYRKDSKKSNYCRAIFLHVDSRSRGEQIDVFFYHAQGSKQGLRLAESMRRTFAAKYDRHQPARGFEGTVSSRNLYVLNHTAPVSVFVELGNIQNSADQRRFVISSNRQALANWMTEGFVADFRKK